MVPNLIWAPKFWYQENLCPKKFGPHMKIITWLLLAGPKLLRDQISWGPNFLGAQISQGPNFSGTKKVRGSNEIKDHFSYSLDNGMLCLVFLIRIQVSKWCLNLKQEIPGFCDFCFQKVCLRCTDTKIQRPNLERIQKIASICKGKNANCKMMKKTWVHLLFWPLNKFKVFAIRCVTA